MDPEPQEAVAKAIVAYAFRNGPIEDIHADGRVSQAEMKAMIKHAVDRVYAVLGRLNDPAIADWMAWYAVAYASHWDAPEPTDLDTAIELARALVQQDPR